MWWATCRDRPDTCEHATCQCPQRRLHRLRPPFYNTPQSLDHSVNANMERRRVWTHCTHYYHHHPPRHNATTADTVRTHYSCLNTQHNYPTVISQHACYIRTQSQLQLFGLLSSAPCFSSHVFSPSWLKMSACILSCRNKRILID